MLSATLVLAMVSRAENPKIRNLAFGTEYAIAATEIKHNFTEPTSKTLDMIVCDSIDYLNVKFDKVVFAFKESRLSEARFVIYYKNKWDARRGIQYMAAELKNYFDLSKDLEDDGSYFYKGGIAKSVDGKLFTLYVKKDNGRWSVQLRYGPYRLEEN